MKKVLFITVAAFALFFAKDVFSCATVVIDVMPQDDDTPTINCKKEGLLPIAALNVCPGGNCGACDNSLGNLEGVTATRCKIDDADGDGSSDDFTCWWRVSSSVCTKVCDGTIQVSYSCGTDTDTDYVAINCPD